MSAPTLTAVREFVARFTGHPLDKVTAGTTLLGDLGVDGDDACELFADFAQLFAVDLSTLDITRHFGPESGPPWAPLIWLVQLARSGTPEEQAGLVPIRVIDLWRAAQAHAWPRDGTPLTP